MLVSKAFPVSSKEKWEDFLLMFSSQESSSCVLSLYILHFLSSHTGVVLLLEAQFSGSISVLLREAREVKSSAAMSILSSLRDEFKE